MTEKVAIFVCKRIVNRAKERLATETYTNDLHEALMQKNNTAFWQC